MVGKDIEIAADNFAGIAVTLTVGVMMLYLISGTFEDRRPKPVPEFPDIDDPGPGSEKKVSNKEATYESFARSSVLVFAFLASVMGLSLAGKAAGEYRFQMAPGEVYTMKELPKVLADTASTFLGMARSMAQDGTQEAAILDGLLQYGAVLLVIVTALLVWGVVLPGMRAVNRFMSDHAALALGIVVVFFFVLASYLQDALKRGVIMEAAAKGGESLNYFASLLGYTLTQGDPKKYAWGNKFTPTGMYWRDDPRFFIKDKMKSKMGYFYGIPSSISDPQDKSYNKLIDATLAGPGLMTLQTENIDDAIKNMKKDFTRDTIRETLDERFAKQVQAEVAAHRNVEAQRAKQEAQRVEARDASLSDGLGELRQLMGQLAGSNTQVNVIVEYPSVQPPRRERRSSKRKPKRKKKRK